MATFTGTIGNESIQPGNVTPTVISVPLLSTPSGAADSINGGGGNDTINGGAGFDTIDGGDNNDRILVHGTEFSVSGGSGTDTFDPQGATDITGVVTGGFEILELDSSALTLTATQLADFDTIAQDGAATTGSIVLTTAAFAVTTVTELATLTVTGSAGNENLDFDTSGVTITDINFNGGTGNDSIDSGEGDDTLAGGTGSDTLRGQGGADSLNGGIAAAGDSDSLLGGTGNDTISFGNDDTVDGGDNDDLFLANGNLSSTATLTGGTGSDTFEAQGAITIGAAVTITGIENLALDGAALTMTTGQLNGFSTIVSDDGAATGNLRLSSGGSATTAVSGLTTLDVTGSADADLLTFTTFTTDIEVTAGSGADSVVTGNGDDTLVGGIGNDTLDGGFGVDLLQGGDNDDELRVRNGDTALGESGSDLFRIFEDVTLIAALNGGVGDDTLDPQGTRTIGASVTISDIENLALDTSTLTLTTGQLDSFQTIVAAGAATTGSIVLSAGGTAVTAVDDLATLNVTATANTYDLTFTSVINPQTDFNVTLGSGNDTVNTNDGDDSIIGGGGADIINSDGGRDTVLGGTGNDTMSVRTGDQAFGEGDNDLLLVGAAGGEDVGAGTTMDGGGGTDTLSAAGAVDFDASVVINGVERLALDADEVGLSAAQLDLIDRITADGGATTGFLRLTTFGSASIQVEALTTLEVDGTTLGESLTFTTVGATVTDIRVDADDGDDTITGGAGNDTLNGDSGEDSLSGANGDDNLKGDAGNDTLLGGNGKDTLKGGDDDDLLIGGASNDQLSGEGGSDLFRFLGPTEGTDTVKDFVTGEDLIQFSAAAFGGGLVAGTPLTADQLVVHASDDATAPAGTGQFIFNTAKGRLLWDADGDGGLGPVKIAKFDGVTTLSTTDFDIIA